MLQRRMDAHIKIEPADVNDIRHVYSDEMNIVHAPLPYCAYSDDERAALMPDQELGKNGRPRIRVVTYRAPRFLRELLLNPTWLMRELSSQLHFVRQLV